METIRVHEEEVQIGTITCQITDMEAIAYVSRKAIQPFLGCVYEVHGDRDVFKHEIVYINGEGKNVKFSFRDPETDPDVMRVAIKQLLTQAATLNYERDRLRSRSSHPSSGTSENGLIMVSSDRAPRSTQTWKNVPPRRRGLL